MPSSAGKMQAPLKRMPAPALLVFIALFTVMPLSSQAVDPARPLHVEKDGIVMDARPLPEQVEGYRHFELKVTNNAQGPRSLHARIVLLTLRGEPAGQCNVYVELSPLESRSRTKACRETALSRGFRLEVVRVYPFLLDREAVPQ